MIELGCGFIVQFPTKADFTALLGTNPAIRIIVKNGRVNLEGYVANEVDKNLAGIAAREIFGVFGVDNNLQVEDRKP